MQPEKQIRLITLVLSTIAGFCDTITFTSVDGLFSAHVTGNFILFADHLVSSSELNSWARLLAFPVFILSVMVGGWITGRRLPRYFLLLMEGSLLMLAGMAALLFRLSGLLTSLSYVYLVALTIVFAMGLQNVFGKVYNKDTYGPTTVMTGNVTQWALDLGSMLRPGIKDPVVTASFQKQSLLIAGFLFGCLAGALAGRFIGLSAVLPAGITLILCYVTARAPENK